MASSALAQAPHIAYVYPAGGRQGESFQITVGGQRLNRTVEAYVTGNGAKVKVVDCTKPLTQKQMDDFRKRADELRKQLKTPDVIKELAEIKKKLDDVQYRRANPAFADRVTLQVSFAADAEPGQRELRLAAENGLSNPMFFQVGQLAEFRESTPEAADAPRELRFRGRRAPTVVPAKSETAVTLPAVLNGQIMPGEVDRFRFQARKGQSLVVVVSARELIPYLADAVPGWFQAAAAIYDSQGNELAYDDHYRFEPDPVLHCKIPKDGEYVLEIRDSIYRGREDFVYRVSVGELPFITGMFPLGGPAGAETTVALSGWNLSEQQFTVDARERGAGLAPVFVRKGKLLSNRVSFAVDTLPECLETEPNDRPQNAQRISVPMIVNGHIDRPGDRDVFRIEGRKDEKIVARVDARKLDSPLDSVLTLTDANGRSLAAKDDFADKASGLSTHQADSMISATLPADGAYFLQLGDVQHKGGAEYAYRLRISTPRSDFALRTVPSSINVRAGTSTPITVHALRKDGFDGEIVLSLKNAPPGFALAGAKIPAKQDQVKFTLTAPKTPTELPVDIHLEGRAVIDGKEIVRRAVPAEDMMQAFIYRHLVPMKDTLVMVAGHRRFRPAWSLLASGTLKLPAGGAAAVQFLTPRGPGMDNIQLALSESPEGITIQNVSLSEKDGSLTLRADAAKVKPGMKGNLIVEAFTERTMNAEKNKKKRVSLGSLPAIPFEIVERQASAAPPAANTSGKTQTPPKP